MSDPVDPKKPPDVIASTASGHGRLRKAFGPHQDGHVSIPTSVLIALVAAALGTSGGAGLMSMFQQPHPETVERVNVLESGLCGRSSDVEKCLSDLMFKFERLEREADAARQKAQAEELNRKIQSLINGANAPNKAQASN